MLPVSHQRALGGARHPPCKHTPKPYTPSPNHSMVDSRSSNPQTLLHDPYDSIVDPSSQSMCPRNFAVWASFAEQGALQVATLPSLPARKGAQPHAKT